MIDDDGDEVDDAYEDDPDGSPEDPDDAPTAPCPHCRRPVYDDAEWCPGCGEYLTREDAPRRRPVWLWLGVIAGLLVILGWLVR